MLKGLRKIVNERQLGRIGVNRAKTPRPSWQYPEGKGLPNWGS